jgi:hypothetical protein
MSSRASTSFLLYIFHLYVIPCWYCMTPHGWKYVIPSIPSPLRHPVLVTPWMEIGHSLPVCHLSRCIIPWQYVVPCQDVLPLCLLPLWHPVLVRPSMAVRHSVPVSHFSLCIIPCQYVVPCQDVLPVCLLSLYMALRRTAPRSLQYNSLWHYNAEIRETVSASTRNGTYDTENSLYLGLSL